MSKVSTTSAAQIFEIHNYDCDHGCIYFCNNTEFIYRFYLLRFALKKFHVEYEPVEYDMVTDVSEQNEDISTIASCKSRRKFTNSTKRCALSAIIRVSMTLIHIMRVLLDGAKWIVLRSHYLNVVNIIKVTKALDFVKGAL